jgi:hypothetical protein
MRRSAYDGKCCERTVSARTQFIEYQLPLRSAVRAHLTLPEDFTTTEVKRVARFIVSLYIRRPIIHRRGAGRVVAQPHEAPE